MSNLQSDNSIPFAEQFQNIAHWLAIKGWSEAAGGNMSIRLDTPTDISETTFIPLPVSVPYLAGKALGRETIEAAARLASEQAPCLSDHYASAEYRQHLVKTEVARALTSLVGTA